MSTQYRCQNPGGRQEVEKRKTLNGALQQWLGELSAVESVEVEVQEETLLIQVLNPCTQARSTAQFTAPGGTP